MIPHFLLCQHIPCFIDMGLIFQIIFVQHQLLYWIWNSYHCFSTFGTRYLHTTQIDTPYHLLEQMSLVLQKNLPLDKEFHIHSEISINQTYFFTITMLNPHIAPYKTAGFLESLYQIFCSILPSFHISFKLLLFNQTRFS